MAGAGSIPCAMCVCFCGTRAAVWVSTRARAAASALGSAAASPSPPGTPEMLALAPPALLGAAAQPGLFVSSDGEKQPLLIRCVTAETSGK